MALGYQKIKDYDNYLKINGDTGINKNTGLEFLIDNSYFGFDLRNRRWIQKEV